MDSRMHDPTDSRAATGYMPIEDYGLIGNMRTCALVAKDGAVDFMCFPNFDSPSIFARMLDRKKGGHFTISPVCTTSKVTTKQQYLPSSNVLQTRFLSEDGVLNLVDFFPRPATLSNTSDYDLRQWLVRKVECTRGTVEVYVNVLPAFNYARDRHSVQFPYPGDDKEQHTAFFEHDTLALQLDVTIDRLGIANQRPPHISLSAGQGAGNGVAVTTRFKLREGQAAYFVLRAKSDHTVTHALVTQIQQDTRDYWFKWISQSTYKGRWREVVSRSLLTLKMLTFEPTGAIIAAPTFSLPEDFGGTRNWDYRYCWVRDASFTIYILLRMGFRSEAEAYMSFMSDRMRFSRRANGGLPIMFSIHGSTELTELELPHLEGYRESKPVRIGNGASDHLQFDIYGELLDGIYLYNKYGKPISYDQWVAVREIVDHVCIIRDQKDMSIWEVRGEIQNFVYSKMMMWVALDRAIRLSDKRSDLPAPRRDVWRGVRDEIYEDVMKHGFNEEMGAFIKSYEHSDTLDSAVLIAPLVFFIAPNDPRFTSTLQQILRSPEHGGLTEAGLVYRYDTSKSDDGVGGREGAFSMCTFWLVEALTRAGKYEKQYLVQAIEYFENALGYGNHLNMFSEEISRSGEQLGNTPQAFSHLSLISAAFNLDRATSGIGGV